MRLHTLKPRPNSRHSSKRVGRGESSGHGKTSGRGHKGQMARSGGSIRLGFEGGQVPLTRRVPKRGFNNARFKTYYAPINLTALDRFSDGEEVTEAILRKKGMVKGRWDGIKILGTGEISKKLSIKVQACSLSAREKIEKAGGSIELIPLKVKAAPAEKQKS